MRYVNEVIEADVLVVGGGLAGCWAGIEAARKLGKSGTVVIVDKGKLGRSGQSPFAAGIYTAFDPEQDDMEVWLREIVEWGEYLNDQEWCKKLFDESMPVALEMQEWADHYGNELFEKDENGRFLRRRGRGHLNTRHMVINSLPMMDTLRRKLRQLGVIIVERVMVTDLVMHEGLPVGALGIGYRDDKVYLFLAKAIVLAASGSGFKSVFMGHQNLTGDLQAAALEAGVVLRNMEQYATNTCSREHDTHGMTLFVGVGGKFINALGEEFMWKYNPILGNLARLQDLALAFCREVVEGRGPVYLDLRAASPQDRQLCRKILPETFKVWDRAGIDPFSQPIEWIPGSYATLISGGGIHVNTRCETNFPYLYAAGDITCEPPHGTYSFAGVNLSFCAVSGKEAGKNAADVTAGRRLPDPKALESNVSQMLDETLSPITRTPKVVPEDVIKRIQETIIPVKVGYLKSEGSLKEALTKIMDVESQDLPKLGASSAHELVKAIEIRSMTRVAKAMVVSSLARKESRGWHFTEDFPRTDNKNWLKWLFVAKDSSDIGLRTWTQDVQTPYVKVLQEYQIPPGVRRS